MIKANTQAQVLEDAQVMDAQAVDAGAVESQVDAQAVDDKQVINALFNGLYKNGKISGGLHSVDDVKKRKLELPAGLPGDAVMFLYFYNNIVAYSNGQALYIKTNAQAHLTNIQIAALDLVKSQAVDDGGQVLDFTLDWKSCGGGSKGDAKANTQARVKNLLGFKKA